MKNRYWLYRRGKTFYLHDKETGKQESLRTKNKTEAARLHQARNESHAQPALNLALARTYLQGYDPKMAERCWQDVMDLMMSQGQANTQFRCGREMRTKYLDPLRKRKLHETSAEEFLNVLKNGTRSTHHFLKRLHNLAIGLGWLAWPVLAPKCWPKPIKTRKRAILWEEHQRLVAETVCLEWCRYYELLWETGASQSDAACLGAENIDWANSTLSYHRMKLSAKTSLSPAVLQIGPRFRELLEKLPSEGFLFPKLSQSSANHRASEFNRKCKVLKIEGISLHSYRYAWAERAKAAGYPERWAKAALGHNSSAVHHAYARNALVTCPSLEDYEGKVIQLAQEGTVAIAQQG